MIKLSQFIKHCVQINIIFNRSKKYVKLIESFDSGKGLYSAKKLHDFGCYCRCINRMDKLLCSKLPKSWI